MLSKEHQRLIAHEQLMSAVSSAALSTFMEDVPNRPDVWLSIWASTIGKAWKEWEQLRQQYTIEELVEKFKLVLLENDEGYNNHLRHTAETETSSAEGKVLS